ncbi:hypothetical protein BJV82DRAFT_588005 [Fennellomyces sp. T-0311]|nr:hypothetical protein BJV82DRAFT_588005 [Fennellomyces sp. T-0311]
MTSTGFFPIQQQNTYVYHQACSNKTNTTLSSRRMLRDMIEEHHATFVMEHRDRPNVLIRVLVALHELGATDEQLARVYNELYLDLTPLRKTHVSIDRDTWQEYLGNPGHYGDYLAFFDRQLEQLGMDSLLEHYFYSSPLQHSLGSQLQPLVYLAFGIEQNLPPIVTQALAYLASTYLDSSELTLLPTSQEHEVTTNEDELLFDLVGADQRFDGKIDGSNNFHASVKVLLKSKFDLLKTYMNLWNTTTAQSLEQLTVMATRLITYSNHINQGQIELDWFLGGGQLLASALAIQTLIDHCPPTLSVDSLVNLQFLATLCTYIVQGRPPRVHYAPYPSSSPLPPPRLDWPDCISAVVESGDPKAILTMQSLKRAVARGGDDLYLNTANFLVRFVQDGIWIKGGIGW